jgi:hypothetical protein
VGRRAYLNLFVYRIDLTPWPFVIGLLATLSVAWVAVSMQKPRAARLKPAQVLRYE